MAFVFACTVTVAWGQSVVQGRVTAEGSSDGLPGANIVVKGTMIGTITDVDGGYRLEVPTMSDTLVFSFVGFVQQTVPIAGRRTINLSLVPEVIQGEELVVVAYGTQRRTDITGSISSVDTETLLKAPTTDIGNALVGKVTGIQTIQRSGQPGATTPEIFIRGVGSISTGRSQPLIIIDGVERAGFAQLDPNNIENISILKDASATAVYGVRGANGAIVVTTKRGQEGPARISINTTAGYQLPTTTLDFADSYTYALRYNEAQINDGIAPENLRFSPEALEAFRTGSDPLIYPNMDWVGTMLKSSAFQTQNNINISGGTENVRYFVAGGFLKQDGLFNTFASDYDYNFAFKRYNFRTNLDIDVTPSTLLSITGGGRIEDSQGPQNRNSENLWRQIYWSVPFSGAGVVDGQWVRAGSYYIPGGKKDGLEPFYGAGYSTSDASILNLDLGVKQKLDFLTKGLSVGVKGAYNSYYSQTKARSSSVATYEPFYRTDVDPGAPGDSTIVYRVSGTDGQLGYSESYGRDRDWYLEARANLDRKFGKHNLGMMLLYNQQKNYYPSSFVAIPQGLVGIVGRVSYGFDDRYLADFNMGYNGSENFAEDNRFGFFPAVSLGWVLSNESFMENVGFVDYFKIRGSYGIVGNDNGVGRFLYLPDRYYTSSGSYSFGNNVPEELTGAREGEIGNPEVQWETAHKQNYGFELTMLDNKLEMIVDYFREYRNNILTTRNTIPAYVAASLPAVNIGEVRNRGFEAELKWRQQLGKFFYNINTNVSYAHNTVLDIDEVVKPEPYMQATGHPVGQRFGYIFDRFWTEADLTDGANIPDHGYGAKPGDLMYKDLNGDGIINTNDQTAIGYPEYPELVFGANIGFSFKRFDMTMVWAGAARTSRLLDGEPYRSTFGTTDDRGLLLWHADDRWTPENAEEATYPRLTFSGKTNNLKTSDFWMYDASYLRLKNFEIGYTLSSSLLARYLGAESVRIYGNGYNLLTFSKLKITDPEARTGYDSDYPITKVYSLGVRLNF